MLISYSNFGPINILPLIQPLPRIIFRTVRASPFNWHRRGMTAGKHKQLCGLLALIMCGTVGQLSAWSCEDRVSTYSNPQERSSRENTEGWRGHGVQPMSLQVGYCIYPAISVTVVANFWPFQTVLNCSGTGNSLYSPPLPGTKMFISEDLALMISHLMLSLLKYT